MEDTFDKNNNEENVLENTTPILDGNEEDRSDIVEESVLEEIKREVDENASDDEGNATATDGIDPLEEAEADEPIAEDIPEAEEPVADDIPEEENSIEDTAEDGASIEDLTVEESPEEIHALINNKKMKTTLSTEKMVGIGIFSALAFVVSLFVRFPVQFLTFDAKDAVITIAAFVYGPLSAVIISLIVAFIEMITVSTTMWYGFLMNFASSAIFSVTASVIYRKKRNLNGAIIGLYSAIAATVGVMLLLNIFITPLYFGLPVAAPMVMEMLPTLLLPFNFAKALMNSAIVMFIYKPVVTALKRLGIVKTQGGSSAMTFNRTTKIILALGAVGLVISIAIFLILVI
jgi:riboflavin transporter FmnP